MRRDMRKVDVSKLTDKGFHIFVNRCMKHYAESTHRMHIINKMPNNDRQIKGRLAYPYPSIDVAQGVLQYSKGEVEVSLYIVIGKTIYLLEETQKIRTKDVRQKMHRALAREIIKKSKKVG